MKRWVFGGIAALLVSTTPALAQHYHQSGIQLFGAPLIGVYKAPVGAAGPGFNYGYTAPNYGFTHPGYAPGPMMAPGGGCWGSGGGAGYGFGYPSQSYGPGAGYGAPQSGVFTSIGGLLEAIRAFKEIRDAIDQVKGGGASDQELQKVKADLAALKAHVDALKFPPNIQDRLDQIDTKLNTLTNVELKMIKDRLTKLEGKPPG